MQTSNANRFFGLNPAAAPNQGKREGTWSHELPRTWREALDADGKAPADEATSSTDEGGEAA